MMLPLVVHFTPQENLQVAGKSRNRTQGNLGTIKSSVE